jgi:hypothetical protein
MGQRLTDRVVPWFTAAFAKEPEDVQWEVTPMVSSSKGLVLYVGALAPGALIGTVMTAGMAIPHPTTITEEGVDAIVRGLMEQIAQGRTAQLAQGVGDVSLPNTLDSELLTADALATDRNRR